MVIQSLSHSQAGRTIRDIVYQYDAYGECTLSRHWEAILLLEENIHELLVTTIDLCENVFLSIQFAMLIDMLYN